MNMRDGKYSVKKGSLYRQDIAPCPGYLAISLLEKACRLTIQNKQIIG